MMAIVYFSSKLVAFVDCVEMQFIINLFVAVIIHFLDSENLPRRDPDNQGLGMLHNDRTLSVDPDSGFRDAYASK